MKTQLFNQVYVADCSSCANMPVINFTLIQHKNQNISSTCWFIKKKTREKHPI